MQYFFEVLLISGLVMKQPKCLFLFLGINTRRRGQLKAQSVNPLTQNTGKLFNSLTPKVISTKV